MSFETINPTTEEHLESWPTASPTEVDAALTRIASAADGWRRTRVEVRVALLRAMADDLEAHSTEHAETMALEMGKPLAEGRAEISKCAAGCRHYAEHGPAMLQPTSVSCDASWCEVRPEPLGAILAIMPWNFPFWQVVRYAAPTLILGNTVLLKHAPNTPLCGNACDAMMQRLGTDVLKNIRVENDKVGDLIADQRIRGVTITGSTKAGREVAAAAGRALKKSVLELGGSDPFLVLADADVEEAAKVAVASRCLNGGQSCIAAKRFFVDRKVEREFTERFVEGMRAMAIGDPMSADTKIGPMARRDLRDGLSTQVERAKHEGLSPLIGGNVPDRRGWFYPPTVFRSEAESGVLLDEETFGPVAIIVPVSGREDMLRRVRRSPYGLGAAVWTRDESTAKEMATELPSGCVFINGLVKSDPRYPFGGIGDSGYGRELGREGMMEFANLKTVWAK